MGYAATSAMSAIDGDTIRKARRPWDRPLERRGCDCCGAAETEVLASAIGRFP
jgi:hypothetical protein